MSRHLNRSATTKVAGVLLFVGAWQLFATLSNTRMLPGVGAVFTQLGQLLASGELAEHAASTLSKGFAGLALALVTGCAVGVWCARNRFVDAALHPLLSMLYPVPKLALYPVVILIFGFGAWSKVVQVGLECFSPSLCRCTPEHVRCRATSCGWRPTTKWVGCAWAAMCCGPRCCPIC